MATSTIPAYFIVTTNNRTTVTIAGNGQQYFNLGTQTGYIPIAVSFETNSTYASASMFLVLSQPYITGSTWSTRLYNNSSSSVTVAGTLYILWMKV